MHVLALQAQQVALASESVPEEPPASDADTVKIQFRLPDGVRQERRFRTEDSVQVPIDCTRIVRDAMLF